MSQLILPGDAGFADVLAGKHFSAGPNYNGVGTMPNKTGAGVILTPSGADQAIPQGYYPGGVGDGKVAAVVVPVANVLTGTTIAGQAGTMPNNSSAYHASTDTVGTFQPQQVYIRPPLGYYDQVSNTAYVYATDPNYISANILSGKSIFGLAGTAKRTANGSVTASSGNLTVSTLPFSPSKVALVYIGVVNTNYGYLIVISSTQDIDGGNASLNYGLYVWNNNGTGYSQQITSQPMTANGFNFTNANIGGSWKYYAME